MKGLAEKAGVSRESLYRMMSETGNPTYTSLEGILAALGFEQQVVPKQPEPENRIEENHGLLEKRPQGSDGQQAHNFIGSLLPGVFPTGANPFVSPGRWGQGTSV